ncbi:disease resistance protein Roq1-like [Prosopis cineraria]|uniref:disease resistance protein Roq1-like n=1 Tax=Prosopis cineraria TaxID=364024 RepID=UPI00240F4A86|nr:disease resistance protein Roq1-like [Prosopis cineraria]
MNFHGFPGSSSPRRTWKYEVFLSFRGEDTRNSFAGHLFSALQRKGIFTFKDDKRLEKGKHIRPELLKAIEQSRISFVVFSRKYADSSWCLDELAKISEAIGEPGCFVVPIFFDIDPSDVRRQSGKYREFFDKHEKDFGDNIDKVQRWRLALTQVASLAGHDVRTKSEADVIEEIVTDAIRKLGHRFSSLADDLVGMQSRAEAFENLLDLESEDVRKVGMWGMPGVGKTTLAAVVYDRISHRFDACCLLLDVSKVHEGPGLVRLQKQLLRETLQEKIEIFEHHRGTNLISTRLKHLKTLIVVDNVDHADQLDKLVGKSAWFGPGSRIIITTRNWHILNGHGVDEVYEVKLLNDEEALQLLCRRAFKQDDPLSDFSGMTHSLLQYAKALPLVIKVLGSFMYGLEVSERIAQLDRLKENPDQEVMGVLETSLARLEKKDKDIFVDIACFFKGAEEIYVTKILEHCGFIPKIGIRVLRDRSLLNIVNGTFWMHDMLQELGWKIAKGEFPDDPAKWSRLWSFKDIQTLKTGTEKVEAIVLNPEDLQETPLKAEALSQMSRLRLIIIPNNVKFSGNLNNLSSELRFLSWHQFPFSSLPSSFEPDKLVELIMPDGNVRQLWEGEKRLPKLTVMDLRGSRSLIKTPNVKGVENLERLDLEGCTGLLQVDPSVGGLKKITFLNLRNCDHLISIPNTLFLLTSLEILNLSGCSRLAKRLNFEGPR